MANEHRQVEIDLLVRGSTLTPYDAISGDDYVGKFIVARTSTETHLFAIGSTYSVRDVHKGVFDEFCKRYPASGNEPDAAGRIYLTDTQKYRKKGYEGLPETERLLIFDGISQGYQKLRTSWNPERAADLFRTYAQQKDLDAGIYAIVVSPEAILDLTKADGPEKMNRLIKETIDSIFAEVRSR